MLVFHTRQKSYGGTSSGDWQLRLTFSAQKYTKLLRQAKGTFVTFVSLLSRCHIVEPNSMALLLLVPQQPNPFFFSVSYGAGFFFNDYEIKHVSDSASVRFSMFQENRVKTCRFTNSVFGRFVSFLILKQSLRL